MQIDYKRDLNHTYVILQEEKEPDTASYQIRMLLTNAIPGLLDCKIGKMDDKTLFYYEVTSRQSLQSVFEQRSIGAEALRKLFEQLLDLLEELGQYLLAPDGLVLQPELVFADANLENFSFCYLPGKQGHTGCFQKQIRELMEYLLPKLDHQEQDAVVLGYGLYREISAEIFSVEMIQALLYQTGKEKKETTEQEGKERPREENPPVQMEETLWEEFEFSEIEDLLDDIFPEKKTDFQDLIKGMLNGETEPSLQVIGEMISDQFFYEWKSSKAGMVHILLIVIVAAVFTNFSNVFQNKQHCQYPHQRGNLFCLTSYRIQYNEGNNAERNTFGNRIHEGHCKNADECRNCFQHIAPVDLRYRLHHEETNNDQCRCGCKGRNCKEDRREEQCQDEQ